MTNRFSQQFKLQAIDHVLSHPEQTVPSVAKLLGVGYSTLDGWLRAHRQSLGTNAVALLSADQQRLRALEREVRQLREVNEILKKAHVYFVNNPSLPSTRS